MRPKPAFFDCAESALLADFGPEHSIALSFAILELGARLEKTAMRGLKECVPALSSLTVFYDPLVLSRDYLATQVAMLCGVEFEARDEGRVWEIPVAYGGEGGPDLKEVAARVGMTEEAVAAAHTGHAYHVYMLGFLPGFAYLGDLPERLRLPRRDTPRRCVAAGSVAIAADMTAVYPLESPGGWHLIGSTPLSLWDMAREEEPLLKPGDRVKFTPVSEQQAEALRRSAASGWRPRPVKNA